MAIVVLKLGLTPLLIGAVSYVTRRWGPPVGGWLVALPLTSGPVLVFMALDHGRPFAATAAIGSLAGLGAISAFCVAYAAAAGRFGPPTCFIAGSLAYVGVAIALRPLVDVSAWLVLAAVLPAILAASRFIRPSGQAHSSIPYPRWDVPARIIVAATLVLGITAIAPLLGAQWSGILATFPVYLSVVTVFTHRHLGPRAAADVLRGLLGGLFGTAAFYLVAHLALEPLGIAFAFGGAVVAALALEALAVRRIRPGIAAERVR